MFYAVFKLLNKEVVPLPPVLIDLLHRHCDVCKDEIDRFDFYGCHRITCCQLNRKRKVVSLNVCDCLQRKTVPLLASGSWMTRSSVVADICSFKYVFLDFPRKFSRIFLRYNSLLNKVPFYALLFPFLTNVTKRSAYSLTLSTYLWWLMPPCSVIIVTKTLVDDDLRGRSRRTKWTVPSAQNSSSWWLTIYSKAHIYALFHLSLCLWQTDQKKRRKKIVVAFPAFSFSMVKYRKFRFMLINETSLPFSKLEPFPFITPTKLTAGSSIRGNTIHNNLSIFCMLAWIHVPPCPLIRTLKSWPSSPTSCRANL